jgi:hypothetical protein
MLRLFRETLEHWQAHRQVILDAIAAPHGSTIRDSANEGLIEAWVKVCAYIP